MKAESFFHSNAASRKLDSGAPVISTAEIWPRALFDGLPGMIYLSRADRARTIEFASAGGHELLGLKPDQENFQLAPLIHPDEREQVLEIIKSAAAAHRAFAVEYRVRHASGQWRTVWDQGRPVPHSHQIAGHLTDVTLRLEREAGHRHAEQDILRTQKFHALNQLAGGVAHEFNNLIAGILGSAELVKMDLPDEHPGHESLKHVFEASNQARDFVHKLRALGQRPPPDFKIISLQPVVEECLPILRTIISSKVELQSHLQPDCPKVHADAAHIHHVILDLCLHAWHGLSDRRGRIKISLEPAPAGGAPGKSPHGLRGPQVCLTVQDNGPGLEKHARELIFHPFRNRRAGGKKIGLELFLVRETVQAHRGEIVVESEPGHGAAFHIYLPVAEEK